MKELLTWKLLSLSVLGFLLPASIVLPNYPTTVAVNSSVSFGIITDMHCTSNNDAHSDGILKAVRVFNGLGLDFTVELGDSISGDANVETVRRQFATMDQAYSQSEVPRYYVIGNHDEVIGYKLDQSAELWKTALNVPSTYYSFDKNGFHFVVLDLLSVNTTELSWLKNDLASNPVQTVIFSHYPIASYDDQGIGWFAGDSSIKSILEASGHVIAAFNGHLHKNVSRIENGIHYYGMNDFPPNAYAVVTIYPDTAIEVKGYGARGITGQDSYYDTSKSLFDRYWNFKKDIPFKLVSFNESVTVSLVKLHLASIKSVFDNVELNGEDIRFVNSTGQTLSYEIESWNRGRQDAVVWVKIPRPTSNNSSENFITMYYGNSDAKDAQDIENVRETKTIIDRFSSVTDITGTKISLLAGDIESPFCVGDTIANPQNGVAYNTTYDASGTWDWSEPTLKISTWISSNFASTNFTETRLYVVDSSGNYRYWDLSFNASQWVNVKENIESGHSSTVAPDLTKIDKIVYEFVPATNLSFYKKLGWTETIIESKKDDGPVVELSDPTVPNIDQLPAVNLEPPAVNFGPTPVIPIPQINNSNLAENINPGNVSAPLSIKLVPPGVAPASSPSQSRKQAILVKIKSGISSLWNKLLQLFKISSFKPASPH